MSIDFASTIQTIDPFIDQAAVFYGCHLAVFDAVFDAVSLLSLRCLWPSSIDAIYLCTKFDAVSCLSLPCRLWGKFSKFDAVFDAVSPFDAEQW